MKRKALPFLPPDSGMGWTPYAWLVYLPTFFIAPVILTRAGQAGSWLWPVHIAATLAFLATYFTGYWVRGRKLIGVGAFHTLLGIVFAPVNPGSCVFFVYGASFIANLDRQRDALRGLILVVLIGAVTGWLTSAPPFFLVVSVVIALMVGGVNLHYHQQARSQDKLRLAQREIEQLAAIAERERIARDLHDVLGHTLSLVVLKAELAVRLSAIDPERAAREMRDVEAVARQTLSDVRLAIRGYRTTLREEIERSSSMLKAARIDAHVSGVPAGLPRGVEETLALVLREAVTNIVRHSAASSCSVVINHDDGVVQLTIRDDGSGTSAAPGLGLRDMRERVEDAGGTLSIDGTRGMRITASLPADLESPAESCLPSPGAPVAAEA